MFRTSLKPGDWLVLLLSTAVVIFLFIQTFGSSGSAPVVRVEGIDESWLYPLDADVQLSVSGPLGDTHVHIHDGAAWVSDSPCREQICVSVGRVSRPGDFIACLPNRVLIRIEGGSEADKGGIDGLAF